MKKNAMKIVLLCGLLIATSINYVRSNRKLFDVTNLFIANIESLAADESNTMKQRTVSNDCTITRMVIVGYNSSGYPKIQQISVPGSQGNCTGPEGVCNPWPCIEDLTKR